MDDELLIDQATEMEHLWPRLARQFFALADDPAADLPIAQLRVCTILQSGCATMSELADELGISMSAVTQIADRLERAGLVERHAESEDRRMKTLTLTTHGAEVMRRRLDRRVESVARVLCELPQARRAEILGGLRDLLVVTESLQRSDHTKPPIDLVLR